MAEFHTIEQYEIQNSNAEAASGWPDMLKDLTNRPFSLDDLHMVSQVASQYSSAKNYVQLSALLEQLQLKYGKTNCWQEVFLTDEKFVLALIHSKMHQHEFREVCRLIEHLQVIGCSSSAEKLVALWNEAHYKEEEIKIGRHLTPVMKYRLRARFPPPQNLHPPGKSLSLRLPRSSTAILQSWYADRTAQMPTSENIENLALEANLTFDQVKNWFRRSVAKHKKEQAEKLHCTQNPLAKLNLCLPLAAVNSENIRPLNTVMESPTKYLNIDYQRCASLPKNPDASLGPPLPLSDTKCANIHGLDALEFKKKYFLGYVPAYCIHSSDVYPNDNPIVMFDARCIRNKIPRNRLAEASSVHFTNLSVANRPVYKMDAKTITGIPEDVITHDSK